MFRLFPSPLLKVALPIQKHQMGRHFSLAISQCLLVFPSFLLFLPLHGRIQPLDRSKADQAALLTFRSGIVDDPQSLFNNWNESIDVCDWNGILCDSNNKRVAKLFLNGYDLRGNISPFLSNLTYLQLLDLSENSLQGTIPPELGSLSRLKVLSLSENQIEGHVPSSFGFLSNLNYISLNKNQLQGQLPLRLFYNCTELKYIDLSNNSFVGFISSRIGNRLPFLEQLYLYNNQLTGNIPTSLSNCTFMTDLDLECNYLSGRLPSDVFRHMTMLMTLHLSYNSFSSDQSNTNLTPFFESLSNLTHLRELELASNSLGGEIPSVIGLLRINLSELHLEDNLIQGAIPPNIADLSNLTLLNLSSNLLNGTIPAKLSLLPKLERLSLSNNSLHGAIPAALGGLPHLGLLDFSGNKLSGPIPASLSNLTQMRELRLNNNLLSGTIPSSLGQCERLEILDLSYNMLTGSIPEEVAALGDMTKYFNASNNRLTGKLPAELSKMDKVRAIDLSSNNLSGRIPPNLGSCQAAEVINLSHNSLEGSIPASMGDLLSIQSLDLSDNQLSGEIPLSLRNCDNLVALNLSFNNLTGVIPTGGIFASLTIDFFRGNTFLCGISPQGLSACHSKKRGTRLYSRKFLIILVTAVSGSVFLLTIFCVMTFKSMRRLEMSTKIVGRSRFTMALRSSHPRITHHELMEATSGFQERLMIGSGSFGHVYKAVLRDGNIVAVKVLQLQAANSSKSFNRECQVLKRIRHRNLIRIVTACSLPDFKALVLPFMANGSLESHLHGERSAPSGLSLNQRVHICSDIAEGMAYLHHHSPVQVIHCDLKPSNILLNDDMTALVSDFGIARLVMTVEDVNANVCNSTNSTANLLCGSIGYIAPEYGLGRGASTKGDVYSFGILVLEMLTRKRPTDDMFSGGLSLRKWVQLHYHGRVERIIDSFLLSDTWNQSPELKNMWEVAIMELIELGLLCSQEAPSTRPTMLDAADDLDRLKRYLCGDTTATFASSHGISSSVLTIDD